MDYAILANEINTDPLGLGYAGQSDGGIAELLNTPNASYSVSASLVPLSLLGIWAAKNDVRKKIEAAANDSTSPVQSICQTIRDLLQGLNGPPFDASNPDNQAMLSALAAAGVLVDDASPPNSLASSLLALATKSPASRAEVLFGEGVIVSHIDVAIALGIRG